MKTYSKQPQRPCGIEGNSRERAAIEFTMKFIEDIWKATAPDVDEFDRRLASFNEFLQLYAAAVAEIATQPKSRQKAARLANRDRRVAWYAVEHHPGAILAAAKAIEAELRRPNQFRAGSPRRADLDWILALSGGRALGHKALEQIIRDHA